MGAMSSIATEPWYVAQQRADKAARLATSLRSHGRTAGDVVRFTDADRRAAEAEAAIRRGSAATWRLATEMLAGSTRSDALCPTCGLGDPLGEIGPRKSFGHEGNCSR